MNIPFGYAALSALILTAPVARAEPGWIMKTEESILEFSANNGGAAVTGGFSAWTATIRYDPTQPETASLRIGFATTTEHDDLALRGVTQPLTLTGALKGVTGAEKRRSLRQSRACSTASVSDKTP